MVECWAEVVLGWFEGLVIRFGLGCGDCLMVRSRGFGVGGLGEVLGLGNL